jgi:hypothetical protein
MQIQVTVYGILTLAVPEPGGRIDLAVPQGTDVQGVIEILQERSPLFEPRASLASIEGVQIPLNHVLHEGDHLQLYLMLGGG